MRRTTFTATALAAAIVSGALAGSALAKQKPITGKFAKPGFTLIAIDQKGKTSSVRLKGGKFSIKPKSGKVTLHLRDKSGVYAGPVVVGAKGSKNVIVGVEAGAKLGNVKMKKGYALAKKLDKSSIDKRRTARAKNGRPIGAGLFGLVSAKASGSGGAGSDIDRDGLPNAFDIDDNGNLVIDNFEKNPTAASVGARKRGARAADAAPPPPPGGTPPPGGGPGAPPPPGGGSSSPQFRVFSNLKLEMVRSLNANASTVTAAQVDQTMASAQTLAIQVAGGSSALLNCGGLTYCSAGGTGKSGPDRKPFPAEFNPSPEGYGTIGAESTGDFQLQTGANSNAIGSGDTLIEIEPNGTEVPGVINYVFATTPALVSWSEGAGSGSVGYPVNEGDQGTFSNPIPVGAGGGDVIAQMTFWRPQRAAVPGAGEGSGWVDIGRLKYTADVPNGPSAATPGAVPGAGPGNCRADSYTVADPNLSVVGDGVVDKFEDAPADAQNKLTFSVNLTKCLAASGLAWSSGQTLSVDIQARSEYGDNAAQKVYLRHV